MVREFRGGPRRRDGRTLKSGGRRRGGGPLQRGLTRTMSTAAGGLPMWSARPRQGRRSYPSSGNAAAALPPSQWPAGRRALSSTQCRARGVVDEVPELSPTSRPSSGAASDSFCTYVWGARSRSSSADATVPLQHWDRHRPAFQGERGPSNQLAQAKQPRKAFKPALRLSMRCIPSRLLTRRVRPFAGVSIWVDRTSQGGWHCVTPGSSGGLPMGSIVVRLDSNRMHIFLVFNCNLGEHPTRPQALVSLSSLNRDLRPNLGR